jgi:hypothetical protein
MSPGESMPPFVIHIKLTLDIQFRPMEGTRMNANVKILESLEELCDYIEEAAKRREKIKAVSTKYSEMWTDISGFDGIVIDTSRYDML